MFVDWSRICLSRLREFLWKGNIPRNPDASGTYAPKTDSQHLHALGGTKHHNKVLYEWTRHTGINFFMYRLAIQFFLNFFYV